MSYQIIPARFTPECAAFLKAKAAANPGLIEFGQHGLHHSMALGGRTLKREFGPERSLAEQAAIIVEGKVLLEERLGGETIDVFTPPQHKFDRNTVKAASAAGHRVFSVSCYGSLRHQLAYGLGRRLGLSSIMHHGISYSGGARPEAPIVELSIALGADDGRSLSADPAAIAPAMQRLSARGGPVGLMLHHKLYGDEMGRAALDAICTGLAGLGPERFAQLGDLGRAMDAGSGAARRLG